MDMDDALAGHLVASVFEVLLVDAGYEVVPTGVERIIRELRALKHDAYGKKIERTYKMIGEPVDFAEAEQLAKDHPYQFQWWTLGLVGARAPLRNSSVKSTSIYTFRPSSGAKMGQEDRH